MKLSSKSGFSPQELQNLSRDAHMKRINPQHLTNLTQDTNMKRLNYVKLASQSGFRPHELPKLSQETLTLAQMQPSRIVQPGSAGVN